MPPNRCAIFNRRLYEHERFVAGNCGRFSDKVVDHELEIGANGKRNDYVVDGNGIWLTWISHTPKGLTLTDKHA